ncbi:MAG: diguanylate cyclase [Roseovarius sp.]|nr:diguanylate cyclase [Roseovarius sp.]
MTYPSYDLLDVLCPMHAVLNATGHVVHAGPTLHKVFEGKELIGKRFLEMVELRRPHVADTMEGLRACHGARLHLRLRETLRTGMKGVLIALPQDGAALGPSGGAIINLSFGISVVDAVRDFSLNAGDFPATDLTIEMLYLIEAKSAAMEASRKLNLRLQGARIAAEEQAYTDTLTGLKNRRAMDHVLERLMQNEQDFALMHLDLDFFKQVNDTMGHAAGDHVLQVVARRILAETRADDLVARTGGDEFVLIFAGLSARDRLSEIATRLISQLEEPVLYNGHECRVSGSIGVTLSCAYDGPEVACMMADADLALYAAKARGRACHVIYDPDLREDAPLRGIV